MKIYINLKKNDYVVYRDFVFFLFWLIIWFKLLNKYNRIYGIVIMEFGIWIWRKLIEKNNLCLWKGRKINEKNCILNVI